MNNPTAATSRPTSDKGSDHMPVTLDEAGPGTDLHTGALIRQALAAQGVSLRVGAGATECGWLATTGHDGPTVYITTHDSNGHSGYDVDRAASAEFSAVVTTDAGTSPIYQGADPEACARAVAEFLGKSPCDWCQDYGSIEIFDAGTDGLTGHRPCEMPPCVKRRKAVAAEFERKRAQAEAEAQTHAAVCGPDCCPPF
ncbi:hypothetical protein ACH4VR_36120 [Streptomyces sp. NPDC020883]|uniref:hypothetical protein n=1 Tax=Streptomyces sp. NPDC020883 TaxID=3365099 RepID=UPI0037AB65E1